MTDLAFSTSGPSISFKPKVTDLAGVLTGGTVLIHHMIEISSGVIGTGQGEVSLPVTDAGLATLVSASNATQTAMAASLVSIASKPGLGALTALPAISGSNGTALGTPPAGARGARLYFPAGSSVTFTIAPSQPQSPPTLTFTASASTTGPNWDEDVSGQMLYLTAVTGSPLFRWI